jgi:ribosomal protein S27AE
MIRPGRIRIRCPRCAWQQTLRPRSDALLEGTHGYLKCPRCGHTALEQHADVPWYVRSDRTHG